MIDIIDTSFFIASCKIDTDIHNDMVVRLFDSMNVIETIIFNIINGFDSHETE